MKKYYIVKDGQIEASTTSKGSAIELIRAYQASETHYLLKPEFSIICGEEIFIPYKK